ncbi:ABC transporter substrate-binding protein [Streptomyces hydrogenans]|uniref:ABC transporter substrate-binding protein n=1 Tax=Streptomyces hydrogenans TaxID=1873719 RepID=UPI003418019D
MIRSLAVVSAVLTAATATSCSGGSKDEVPAVKQSDLISSLPAAKGKVDEIRWNLTSGEPDTLDPANAASYAGGQVVRNLCDSLLTLDPDYKIKPNLTTYKQVSPTKLVLTLRSGPKFWDGTPVTAEDVAYSMQRAANPDYVSSYLFANVDSIKVTGGNEVTVSFSAPDALFASELAAVVVVQKAFTEKVGEKLGTPSGGLMCSGPFKLDKWTSGHSLVINRNDAYWNSGARPFAKKVTFSFLTEGAAVTQALNAGEIDGSYELPASTVPSLRSSKAGRLTFGLSPQIMGLSVASRTGALASDDLRAALERIIDRKALASAVFHGAATPLYTSTPPSTWPAEQKAAYEKAYRTFETERSYDPDAARQLVKKSGYNGADIVIAISAGDETQSRTAQLIQQQAALVGLRIKIQTMQPLVYAQASYDASKREGIDILLATSFSVAPDPLESIGFNFLPDETYNYTNYNDKTATKLINEARATFDVAERSKKVIAAQEIFERSETQIPLVAMNTTTFLNNRLTGAVTSFAYWSMPQMAFVGAPGK